MSVILLWSQRATIQLNDAIAYIGKDSFINAEKVRERIFLKAERLLDHPELYTPDKYKLNNDGTYRAFETDHYRITYRYKKIQFVFFVSGILK